MQLGKLTFNLLPGYPGLVAEPIRAKLAQGDFNKGVFVAAVDPELADTAAFCQAYGIGLEASANCIIVEAKRGDMTRYAACIILATDMIDVNSKVRRLLDARKASFAPRDTALKLTGMEYGGVTPLGLPEGIQIIIDEHVLAQKQVIIGGGIRGSKILIETQILADLPQATVVDIAK
jgi:prolyl-tRNA editing enzyme YbaK/EbsC (Cys-tRNA(Pro) deacylase)